jgi:hypothetical protein
MSGLEISISAIAGIQAADLGICQTSVEEAKGAPLALAKVAAVRLRAAGIARDERGDDARPELKFFRPATRACVDKIDAPPRLITFAALCFSVEVNMTRLAFLSRFTGFHSDPDSAKDRSPHPDSRIGHRSVPTGAECFPSTEIWAAREILQPSAAPALS